MGYRSVRVLAALNGSSLAEATLLPAASLSLTLSAPLAGAVQLVRVIPEYARDKAHDEAISRLQAQAIVAATTYLNEVEQRRNDHDGRD